MDNATPETTAELPPAEIAPADGATRAPDLKAQLLSLRQHAQAAVERVSGYLQRMRHGRGDAAPNGEVVQQILDTLDTITQRQDSLEMLLQETGSETAGKPDAGMPTTTGVPAWAAELRTSIASRLDGIERRLEGLTSTAGLAASRTSSGDPTEELTVIEEPPAPRITNDKSAWLRVLLGDELHDNAQLKTAWSRLQQQVLASHAAALALLGQVLVFRFAEPERKPALLKDVGEALYRYAPKTRDVTDPLEQALSQWAARQCEQSGLPNSIELVHPGERFDGARHSPVERGGAEVVQVLGWVVLRDAGRVFSKALVLTR